MSQRVIEEMHTLRRIYLTLRAMQEMNHRTLKGIQPRIRPRRVFNLILLAKRA